MSPDVLKAEAAALAADPRALLAWYVEAGIDVAIGTTAPDRTQAPEPPPLAVVPMSTPDRPAAPARPRPAFQPGPGGPPGGRAVAVPAGQADAAHAAAQATSLEALQKALTSFTGCPLKDTATNTVFADGPVEAPVMVIGEAPGADEDRLGLPFVGASGRLLDRMLASIGLDRRENCYITNILPWRPPGNRKPDTTEVALCVPFIERHIALKDPRLLILVGGLAAQTLFAESAGITRLRGQWRDYATPGLPGPVPALATFHPAYLLRSPEQKRLAWRDLVAVRQKLDSLGLGG
ncbi:uracil-DNA glycosylase [Roseospirillum parvum]|uniref:Type-4 uracil-DNA glycosylase n=1 Tax=Roseospirillum parvum TaxID=83401 RepID=A0A1G7W4F1_9PROT|nr:uracil-DNA glycosylase [Roseospirillum parvum]SDG66788.1 DNA polymerase [Roseospirillum parvum]